MRLSAPETTSQLCWLLLTGFSLASLQHRKVPRQAGEPVWGEIEPKPELDWEPCYGGEFDCARLIVPMDYEEPHDNRTVILAVLRLRATDTENYKGTVFFNPGGPGSSGISYLSYWPNIWRVRLGHNYDVVTWDIRGTSRSTPRVDCWANQQRYNVWNGNEGLRMPDEHETTSWIAYLQARQRYQQSSCIDLLSDTGILETVHTGTHARDMNTIAEALGETKIQFWGESWGTALGGYYASMYPHKVERMVLEGNMDLEAYVVGDESKTFEDTSKTLDYFFETCSADPDCPFNRPTPEGVRDRWVALEKSFRDSPRISWTAAGGMRMQTVSHLIYTTFMAMHGALNYGGLNPLANSLVAWEAVNGTTSEDRAIGNGDTFPRYSNIQEYDPWDPDRGNMGDSNKLTRCNDLPPPLSPGEMAAQIVDAKSRHLTGGFEVFQTVTCSGGLIQPKNRFTGPFGGNTSFPILFINSWDAITPMGSAYRNSKLFPGSRVLELEAHGHIITSSSQCIADHMQAYFQKGTLPSVNTTCSDVPGISYGPGYIPPPMIGEDFAVATSERAGYRVGNFYDIEPNVL